MQQTESATNMLAQCQAKDLGNTGKVTITQFREALVAVHPELTESEIKHTLRDIEAIDGKIEYGPAIITHEL